MNEMKMFKKFKDERANRLAYEIWSNKENYEIVHTNGKKGKVIVFFSGHGLYYPNTYEEFNKAVVINNKFEWNKIARNPRITTIAEEIVFVRDVYKVWCINGINASVNSQDRLASFLQKIVGDRELITVGSSAGGYMAILFGCLLNAVAIYAFSPQVNLHEYNKDHIIDYYADYVNNSDVYKYMNLKPLIDNYKGDLFYWYPAKCTEDIRQYKAVSMCSNIVFFAMDQTEHGATLWGESIIRSLELSEDRLKLLSKQYANKIISPRVYCSDTSGILKAMGIYLVKRIKGRQ